ncbi:mannosyltransferase OCH1-like enzyme [Desulfitobacterium dichloroeliminans LMG P-21439]|uniref:Mannosyltransferase OCH1-like enzyme n=1 Tax=Desulfitobacterium dichloroeliminans (strain LMG P-21439 / DCA1) TaxID=871963 RepID=L0FBA5_DESDL|nr:glycosyltransferase [Desulfitobacterium dichloroeliminans]AGA70310.1 mannosyltransferase OCH1-like enzyme [Desulfitobacterium dichloroeliminans LMG P-21439]
MNILYECIYEDFVAEVKAGEKHIICFGAGMVATSIEHIFQKAGISECICCFIDNNPEKHGTYIKVAGRDITIQGISALLTMDFTDKLLLITCQAFESVIHALEQYEELQNLKCYSFTAINRSYIKEVVATDKFCSAGYKEVQGISLIPKTLHYCWFGGGELSAFMQDCIASWRQYNPEYEIICWNEDNYDVYQTSYMRQAYGNEKFAFVSDYARLDILYRYGGVYLDTDVEVVKCFDNLLYNQAFISYAEWPLLNSAIVGSVPGHETLRQMRDKPRAVMNFINADGSCNLTTNSVYESAVLLEAGMQKNFAYQLIADIAVYPPCFLVTSGLAGCNAEIDERTFAIHHCLGSWTDGKGKR